MEKFFPKELEQKTFETVDELNHLYAVHAVVYELCNCARREGTLLEMLLEAAKKLRV